MVTDQLECRVVITHYGNVFEMGMYDPVSGRYEKLGRHPKKDIDKIVNDLKTSIERAGHLVTFSEITGDR